MTDEGSERTDQAGSQSPGVGPAQPEQGNPPTGQDRHHHRDHSHDDWRRKGLWPIALVAVGLLLLAGNFGLDFAPFWRGLGRVWSLWPIALIAVGSDMLTRGKYRLLVISLAIGVAVVIAFYGGVGGAPSSEPVSINFPAGDASSARVELHQGVSPLDLTTARSNSVLWGTVQLAGSERLDQKSVRRGNTVEVTLKTRGTGWSLFGLGGTLRGEWELELNKDLPTDLIINAGVGDLQLDLRHANLRGFDLDAGVGDITMTLPGSGDFDAKVDGGVGELTILVPQSLSLRAHVDSGLGSINVGEDFERSGNAYLSPAAAAGRPVTVNLAVDAGVGSVNIRSVE